MASNFLVFSNCGRIVVVHSFWRKRERKGHFEAENGFRRVNPSTGFRNAKTPRIAPETPGEAQKRPRLRALRNGERRFHLVKMVEETAPTNKHSPTVDEFGGSRVHVISSTTCRFRSPLRTCMSPQRAARQAGEAGESASVLRRYPGHGVPARRPTLAPTESSARPRTEAARRPWPPILS